MSEVLPPMIKCCDCIYSQSFKDPFNGKTRYMCQRMMEISEFGDFYSITDSGCTEGKEKPVDAFISTGNDSDKTANNYDYLDYNTKGGRE